MSGFKSTNNINDIDKIDSGCIMINLDPEITIYKSNSELFLTSFSLNIFLKLDSDFYNSIIQDLKEFNYIKLSLDNKTYTKHEFKNIEYT